MQSHDILRRSQPDSGGAGRGPLQSAMPLPVSAFNCSCEVVALRQMEQGWSWLGFILGGQPIEFLESSGDGKFDL